MDNKVIKLLTVACLLMQSICSYAQLSTNEEPVSFSKNYLQWHASAITLPALDMNTINKEDSIDDADTIPIGMKLYPGNESEKPYINDAIETLRKKYKATGKIIRVADKGLNCADNIANAILAGDGYIFSKSIKQLPKKELT